MQFSLKTWLHLIGSALGLSGVVFVVIRLSSYSGEIDLGGFNGGDWLLIALLSLFYGAATTFLVQAWRELLGHFGVRTAGRWALKAYGQAQIAKYVPGNVLHLAGRQALGMAAGLPGVPLAKSVMWELICFSAAGAFFGGLASALIRTGLPPLILGPVFVAVFLGAVTVLRRFWAPAVGNAFAWQFLFLTISSSVFVAVAALFTPLSLTIATGFALAAAFVVAWLAGLVTPGAPAGIGVRELVLLFLLRGLFAESDLLLAVVLGRCITVLGDFLFFLYAYLSPGASAKTPTADG